MKYVEVIRPSCIMKLFTLNFSLIVSTIEIRSGTSHMTKCYDCRLHKRVICHKLIVFLFYLIYTSHIFGKMSCMCKLFVTIFTSRFLRKDTDSTLILLLNQNVIRMTMITSSDLKFRHSNELNFP